MTAILMRAFGGLLVATVVAFIVSITAPLAGVLPPFDDAIAVTAGMIVLFCEATRAIDAILCEEPTS